MNITARNKAEADYACKMVLKIVRHLVKGHHLATATPEPASLPVYDTSLAPWVEKRSDKRGPAADSPKHNRRADASNPERSH